MSEFLTSELQLVALQLHFSAAPAQLARQLLLQAQEYSHSSISQFTQEDWRQAVQECTADDTLAESMPGITWDCWQASWPKAMERAQLCAEKTSSNSSSINSADILCVYGSSSYPNPLYKLFRPPFALFARGGEKMPASAAIAAMVKGSGFAVCGSRKVTLQGRSDAFAFAYGVCKHSNFYLVSGLSEGIELAACEGALAAGGRIVGVLCCGLDAIAPEESLQMAGRILGAGGLLVSEYPPLQARQRYTFLQRNRILAALASSLIMVELGPKTKALNLVDYALELNHDVAVLGNSVGVSQLREQGCAHWPDAPSLLQALGMACSVSMQQYPDEAQNNQQLGKLVAGRVYEELLDQRQHYLGRKVGES